MVLRHGGGVAGQSGGLSSGVGGMIPGFGWCPGWSAYLPSEFARDPTSGVCLRLPFFSTVRRCCIEFPTRMRLFVDVSKS
ncbi:hypothetical protein IG631_20796 [Alternaria alternata]|nr:hypothetical protein IG631_20796 [Alternaria alternata]